MPLINGRKYSCEPCIRGHRATSCAHTDRILVEVRKPGRPLESCAHQLDSCSCGRLQDLFSIGDMPVNESFTPEPPVVTLAAPAPKPMPRSKSESGRRKVSKSVGRKKSRPFPTISAAKTPVIQHPDSSTSISSLQPNDSTSSTLPSPSSTPPASGSRQTQNLTHQIVSPSGVHSTVEDITILPRSPSQQMGEKVSGQSYVRNQYFSRGESFPKGN